MVELIKTTKMSSKNFIKKLYKQHTQINGNLPDRELSFQFIEKLFEFLFIPKTGINRTEIDIEKGLYSLQNHLTTLIYEVTNDGNKSQKAAEKFFSELPSTYDLLLKDAEAFVKNDPAALGIVEVFNSYPGFFAIAVYRISHLLWQEDTKILPRMFTEYAHSKTGIDIHPGANIGKGVFIDHGTGVVIGETSVIGNNVKIYQGVTIGAFNSSNGELKRHPTIEDNVILYSGAAILGGETIIGKDSVVGANVWVTYSVPAKSLVFHKSEVVAKGKFSHQEAVADILKNNQ